MHTLGWSGWMGVCVFCVEHFNQCVLFASLSLCFRYPRSVTWPMWELLYGYPVFNQQYDKFDHVFSRYYFVQVSADTVRVMDAVESFAAQTATANCNLILTPDDVTVPSFEGKYDNVGKNHCCVLRMGRKAVGPVCCKKKPKYLLIKHPRTSKGEENRLTDLQTWTLHPMINGRCYVTLGRWQGKFQ